MKNKTHRILFATILLAGAALQTSHAQIAWGTATDITADDVATNGTVLDAVATNNDPNGFTSTGYSIDSIDFSTFPSGADVSDAKGDISLSTSSAPTLYQQSGTRDPGASTNFNTMVYNTVYLSDDQVGTISLSGLTAGDKYQVQVFSAAPGNGNFGATVLDSTGGSSVDLNPVTGQYVLGTFTAGSSLSQSFTFDGSSLSTVNSVVVSDLGATPEPSTWALLGVSALGAGFFKRRRCAL